MEKTTVTKKVYNDLLVSLKLIDISLMNDDHRIYQKLYSRMAFGKLTNIYQTYLYRYLRQTVQIILFLRHFMGLPI